MPPSKVKATSAKSASSASTAPKKTLEYVIHIHMWATAYPLLLLPDSLLAKLIICAPLIWITKGFIRICNLLKFDFCTFGVILILIRMMLDGEFFELFLDFLICGVSLDPQDLVVVFTLFLSGRRTLLLALAATTASEASTSAATLLMMPLSTDDERGAV